ncbi:SDR family NAD(P)-dependent oxidoreductase [Paenibacillus sp. FSL R5-0701]|uniref:SDR family NAD(P)-dependent oxidoreductase n=1 Tax=Paenibacillus sp. FSL R5-0701 TaxID=2921654 RepID=UPI0030CA61C7
MDDQVYIPITKHIPEGLRSETDQLHGLLVALLSAELKAMGLFEKSYSNTREWLEKNGIPVLFHRWMEETLAVLAKEEGNGAEGGQTATTFENVWQKWDEVKQQWLQKGHLRSQVLLAETALKHLPDILRGYKQATDVLFPNSSMTLVEGIYQNNPIADYFNEVMGSQLITIIEEKIKKNATIRLRIIEFGAGTGGTSTPVLDKLRPYEQYIEEYCYTDISSSFLLQAEQRYGNEHPYLTYRKIDVTKQLQGQSINEAVYDIAIAANVLHATPNIRQTLGHIKAAIKKQGYLLLNEITDNTLFAHITFGLLEGWWLYEDEALRIPGCPGLTPNTWKKVLAKEGFRNVRFPALNAEEWGQQIVVSQSDGIIIHEIKQSPVSHPVLTQTRAIPDVEWRPNSSPVMETGNIQPTADIPDHLIRDHIITVIRDSIETSLKMSQNRIDNHQSFSEYGVDSIVAVNLVNLINEQCGIVMQTTVLFDHNTVHALSKHMLEQYRQEIVAYMLPDPATSPQRKDEQAIILDMSNDNRKADKPAVHRNEDRLPVRDERSNPNATWTSTMVNNEKLGSISEGSYYRLLLEKPGEPDELKLIQDKSRSLQSNEVQIAVYAFSLNFGDLLCVRGLYPTMPAYPVTPGFEVSGVVVQTGSEVTDLRSGEEVVAMMGEQMGGHANMVICPAAHVVPKPKKLTFEEACSLPAVTMTMLDVFHKAKPQPGEKILIQTAAGGTGLIAVQLAQHYGLEIYATAGSDVKLNYLQQQGVHHTIQYVEQDFAEEIHRLTNGQGVDIVINTLSGDAIQKGMACLAPGGRYIEIAMTALKSAKNIDLSLLSNNQAFYSVDLRRMAFRDPSIIRTYMKEMAILIDQNIVRPTIYATYPFQQVKEAYKAMGNRSNIGKIVVHIPEEQRFKPYSAKPWEQNVVVEEAIMNQETPSVREEIAIIGISGRFAQSRNPEDLWQHLQAGNDLIGEVKRWDLDAYYADQQSYCRHGSFIEDFDRFDPLFFNISGVEATYMDPQQRIFLEESWKALEDGGYAGKKAEGLQCGVYVGCSGMDYQSIFGHEGPPQAFWGNANSIVPARIAYYLNLHGPAITVDTACSSSLVAIHLACQGLWSGETNMALAGGVFIQSTPGFYIASNRAGMLSPTGRCHTFDEAADGFVPGEGAGVVILKRLSEALDDGDQIYGVIRGSGINQDGSTNGITAPSAKSQERLEQNVYETFNINPEHIQLVEAHGTGTRLGDPIEFNALAQAFRKHTDEKQFCAIGSVKSNIGHTATAAGVAGLFKIMLGMRHQKIAPSIHFHQANSQIVLNDSPFYIPTDTMEWKAGSSGKRCAAISSFGFSGTNAHMVIEEGPLQSRASEPMPGYLIALSARTAEQLRQQVEQLTAYGRQLPEQDCGNLSYTLLLGRKHMDFRLACVTRSLNEAMTILQRWLDKGSAPQVRVSQGTPDTSHEHSSLQRYGNECLRSCQKTTHASEYLEHLGTAADLYIQGYELDYDLLFEQGHYWTISLPTYPFARERYWVEHEEMNCSPLIEKPTIVKPSNESILLHSMLHHNRSDLLRGQWYSSQFNGNEPFLSDHVVQGHKLLPAVVQLEMARAAAAHAANWPPLTHSLLLRHVMWSRPLVVGEEPLEVHLALEAEADESLSYKISAASSIESSEAVYSQGRVSVGRPLVETVQTLDLHAVRSRCTEGQASGAVCYEAFRKLGLEYGPSHQTIAELQWGANETLAQLRLPQAFFEGQADTVLHPGMVDGALQASIALLAGDQIAEVLRSTTQEGTVSLESTALASTTERHGNPPASAPLPFALEEAEVISPCQAHMWAVVRVRPESAASSAAEASVRKLDLELCDSEGQVCIRLRGVTSRVPESREGVLLVQPKWQELPKRSLPAEAVGVEPAVLLCDWAPQDFAAADVSWKQMVLTGALEARYGQAVQAILHHVQQQLAMQRSHRMAVQVVVAGDEQGRRFAGLSGLLRTVRLEHPGCLAQLVEVQPETSAAILTEQLHQCALHAEESHLRWEAGELKRVGWQAVDVDRDENVDTNEMTNGNAETEVKTKRKTSVPRLSPWRDGGVYVITGGAGGLGRIWAREISAQTEGSTLILTGRSPAMPEAVQREMAQLPAQVLYEAVDVTDREAVHGLFGRIRQQYGRVNGVLHCAGEIRDSLIRYKTESDWQAVLAPKVVGIRNLEEAIGTEALDVLLLFSSGAAVTGNAGQGDYAAANGYMDAYAVNRNARMKRGECQGRTLSINWPLWEEGGMQLEEEGKQRLWKQHGLRPLGTASGVKALYQAWESGSSQVAVAEGKLSVLRRSLLEPGYSGSGQPIEPVKSDKLESMSEPLSTKLGAPLARGMTQQEAIAMLTLEVAALLNVGEQDVDPDMDWSEYGLDLVQWSELSRRLLTRHGWDISAETLLEHLNMSQTVQQVTGQIHPMGKERMDLHKKEENLGLVHKNDADLRVKTVQFLQERLARVIGLPKSRIDVDTAMDRYGIDSLLIMQMTTNLEEQFGLLPKTLFFEYQTLRALSEYFLEHHHEPLRLILGEELPEESDGISRASVAVQNPGIEDVKSKGILRQKRTLKNQQATNPESKNVGSLKSLNPIESSNRVQEDEEKQDIAIIGVAGRYPGARNIHEFWENLRSGTDSITEIPSERWDQEQVYDSTPGTPGKTYGRWGGFLDGVDEFDPLFFQISPREAEMMDPQERLFMQCVYETIEDAGYTRERLATDIVGVYVGVMYEEYQLYGAESSIALSGNPASIANRVSYFCNFRGPSLAVDTMCSSSLTSIHLACQSLRQNECQVAVAGGVNVSVHPNKYIMLSQGRFLSSKGRCESFGEGGDGYVPGEGVGAVLLKSLARAVADGDRIYGVIKGSALNHGGKTNGYTVPNPNAQADVIGRALREAGVDPRTISYVEAHGTGTSLGDPIEIAGLSKAFQQDPSEEAYCAIGSAKSNIGHAESAAGIAGVTKVLLQLQHGELAPSLHVQQTNPHIDFSQTPFTVQRELDVWERPRVDGQIVPRRAGISSFGAGGANAHLILEEYREPDLTREKMNEQNEQNEVPGMIVLSAKNEERLVVQARQLRDALRTGQSSWKVREIAYTLQTGREAMEVRLGVLAQTMEELLAKLDSYVEQVGQAEPAGKGNLYYQGHVKQGQEHPGWLTDEEDMKENVKRWLSQGRYEHVLDAWTRGAVIQWMELYGDNRQQHPRPVSLPAYPFARNRYWAPKKTELVSSSAVGTNGSAMLHPLLHSNTSDLQEQRYTSLFTMDSPMLMDINKEQTTKLLPDLLHLEIAYAALDLAIPDDHDSAESALSIQLQDVIWDNPIYVSDQPLPLHISLQSESHLTVGYVIYGENVGGFQPVYSSGMAKKVASEFTGSDALEIDSIDMLYTAELDSSITAFANHASKSALSSSPYAVERIYVGEDHILIKFEDATDVLSIPPVYKLPVDAIHLAVYGGLGWTEIENEAKQQLDMSASRPVYIQSLQRLDAVGASNISWARVDRRERMNGASGLEVLDIRLYSSEGRAVLKIQGLEAGFTAMSQGTENDGIAVHSNAATTSAGAFVLESSFGESEKETVILSKEASSASMASRRRPELLGLTTSECVRWELKELAGQTLKIPRELIDGNENLAEYGFDSISLTEYATVLNQHFGMDLAPSIFFDHTTLHELAHYLEREFEQTITDQYADHDIQTGEKHTEQAAPLKSKVAQHRSKARKPNAQRQASGKYWRLGDTRRMQAADEPVAIIGISGRFPEARNVDEMWSILVNGQTAVKTVPSDRFTSSKKDATWKCGLVPGIREFDPRFFEISPREAESMDPRQRLLLQESWRALEDAAYGKKQLSSGRVGMFVGVENNEYLQFVGLDGPLTSNHNAILAARLAYLLDLNGPNMAINTACSSGLAAVHQACASLRAGECDTALAAGVSLLLTEQGFEAMSQAGMLSEDGRCYAFDQRANGMVPGEAIAVVVLKTLSQAEADGDSIYGVIRGSGMNYDGKTNGITAPSGVAQTALMNEVYARYGIPAEDMQYIVTHGTGTRLGDPVEIKALQEAYKGRNMAPGSCALTSVKTNLGHTLAASGVVSLISLVQAMRYETIPASLHCEEESEYIQWSEGPFYVNKSKRPWPRTEQGRLGAVSAFGMSGTNVHVVVESYEGNGQKQMAGNTAPYYLLALSAKTEEALHRKVEDMIAVLEREEEPDLAAISYTLLEGRQHFRHRCAVVVQSRADAVHVWKQFGTKENNGKMFRGTVGREFTEQRIVREHGHELLHQLQHGTQAIATGAYRDILHVLADLYCQGYALDWMNMYGESVPERIHLPSYPFAQEEYWVTQSSPEASRLNEQLLTAKLHPLVHRNTSTLREQRYSSVFAREDPLLHDPMESGYQCLPDSAHLEMARAAAQYALKGAGEMNQAPVRMKLTEHQWVNPVVVTEQALEVHLAIIPESDQSLIYEIFSERADGDEELWSRGRIEYESQEFVSPPMDMQSITERCTHLETAKLSSELKGSSIVCCYTGENEVLIKLSAEINAQDRTLLYTPKLLTEAVSLAANIFETRSVKAADYLNKAMLAREDGELSVHEVLSKEQKHTWLSMESMEFTADHLQHPLWMWIRELDSGLDVTFCDEKEQVVAHMAGLQVQKNLMTKDMPEDMEIKEIEREVADDSLLMAFEEIWEESEPELYHEENPQTILCVLSRQENQERFISLMKHHNPEIQLVFIDPGMWEKETDLDHHAKYREALQEISQQYGNVDTVLHLSALEEPLLLQDTKPILLLLQALAAEKIKPGRILLAGEYRTGIERCYLDAWIGFERSLGLVMPHTKLQVISSDKPSSNEVNWKRWSERLWQELRSNQRCSVRYENDLRKVSRIRPISPAEHYKQGTEYVLPGKTYLITGGLGGIGLAFARAWAPLGVNLVLMGRSSLDSVKQHRLDELIEAGSQAMYVQADVAVLEQVEEAVRAVKSKFGTIHGLIHAAGIESRVSVLDKSAADFERVLAPKIRGTLALDKALGNESLEFRSYFSSSSAILGDFGSCDYAVANRFQMAYAQEQHRTGPIHTVSINWPLWREGGMGTSEKNASAMYLKTSGQRFLEKDEGVALFPKILNEPYAHQLVMAGKPERIHRFLGVEFTPEEPASTSHTSYEVGNPVLNEAAPALGLRVELSGKTVAECAQWELGEIASELLKIPHEELDPQANLAEFGFDSISLTEYAARLSRHYGAELTPSIFFGHSTLKGLAEYLENEHRDVLVGMYEERKAVTDMKSNVADRGYRSGRSGRWAGGKSFPASDLRPTARNLDKMDQFTEPVAIIGISGRFPEARDVDEMWSMISQGQEAIRRAPEDRFSTHNGREPWKCGLVPGVREFDPRFFEISPREAESMDPRQRLLLQESWRALEDAAYGKRQLSSGRVGMFVGVENNEYLQVVGLDGPLTSNHNAILAARLAYLLDLNGPNMAINTACSSGLAAVHQACASLRAGECDTALAAGVSLLLTEQGLEAMSQAGMLSENGRCYAFDQRANGMVPGEAIAVVVLKTLSQAEADGDSIYGVIRGSGMNYDGKTNGITAPSGVAQTALMNEVYTRYGIRAENMQYIVTHGTGTRLGDPVEINALQEAYKSRNMEPGSCALTSVKTNLGHTLAASGVVSLISLVQAMRHETIPASLHCEEESEYIRWSEGPFYVNKSNRPWPRTEQARLGAVSAFGMSGTNVHVVVESYEGSGQKRTAGYASPYYLLALSAKTEAALQRKVEDMIAVLEREEMPDLTAMSYTLLEGRQHFRHRCAVVVQSREDAVYMLKQRGQSKSGVLFEGVVPRRFTGQKLLQEHGDEWIIKSTERSLSSEKQRDILHVLADLYAQGYDLNWGQMYGDVPPSRISLPTYPFAREEYWMASNEREQEEEQPSRERSWASLHPLVQQNTSDFTEQRFSSVFNGREFFLKDHIIHGISVLPGVAQLEMARAALQLTVAGTRPVFLQNVVWISPVVMDGDAAIPNSIQVEIGLHPVTENPQRISYEIYRQDQQVEGKRHVYSQGQLGWNEEAESPPIHDLNELMAACSRSTWTGADCYNAFRQAGIQYGPAFEGIQQLFIGEREVLAQLKLPEHLLPEMNSYVLHPCILDSALQASIGMMLEHPEVDGKKAGHGSGGPQPSVPFALKKVRIYKACAQDMWAWVRYSSDSSSDGKGMTFDIDLFDQEGSVCVRLIGFSSRQLPDPESTAPGADTTARSEMLLLKPYWREMEVEGAGRSRKTPDAEHIVILCGALACRLSEMQLEFPSASFIPIGLDQGMATAEKWFEDGALQVFGKLQTILSSESNKPRIIQAVVPNDGEQRLYAALSGMLQSIKLEYPAVAGQLIEMDEQLDNADILQLLKLDVYEPKDNWIRYTGRRRELADWQEIEPSTVLEKRFWRDHGVYLITGGMGGLGLVFAQEIATQAKHPTLVLVGRSPMDGLMEQSLEILREQGARVDYLQVDVTDGEAVENLVGSIKQVYGAIHGVIHGAGLIRDSLFLAKTEEEWRQVMKPKVAGTIHLDRSTHKEALDFFILFSSGTAVLGNMGQSDYATANAFMDLFATYRETMVSQGKRSGRTLSLNWPLWENGGMKVDSSVKQMMWRQMGMRPLHSNQGIEALTLALSSTSSRVMVMAGNPERIRGKIRTVKSQTLGISSPMYTASPKGDKPRDDRYSELVNRVLDGELTESQFVEAFMKE